jgi:hypothetical protein
MDATDATTGLTSIRIPSKTSLGRVVPRIPEMKFVTTNSSKEVIDAKIALVTTWT